MKKNWILVPMLALLAFVGSVAVVKADADTKEDKMEAKQADHYSDMATKYEKMASDQESVIAEHETMKVDYAKQHAGKPGVSENGKMAKHCNMIIKDAKKLKADYEGFASWCKMMAKEDMK